MDLTVAQYILSFPENVQVKLNQISKICKELAPKATELISYQMPAYQLNGNLFYFAAYKNHIGFYPHSSPIVAFKNELVLFKTSKGAIQFPIEKPLPIKLIKKIIRFRIKENLLKATLKKQTKNKILK